MIGMKPVLLIIDVQNEWNNPKWEAFVPNFKGLVQNIKALKDVCKKSGIPVIYSRHVRKKDGSFNEKNEPTPPSAFVIGTKGVEISDEIAPDKNDIVIDKTRFSVFYKTDLLKTLKKLKADTMIITGIMTNACVRTTAIDAYQMDYNVVVVSDCCATTSKEAHEANLEDLRTITYGLQVLTSEEVERMLRGELS